MKLYYIVTTHFYDLLGHGSRSTHYVGRVAAFIEYQHADNYLLKLQKWYPSMNFWITEESIIILKLPEIGIPANLTIQEIL
jgi:hypothetical protein